MSSTLPERTDVAVIGAGIVGLATARAIKLAHPELSVTVLDKESDVAAHQTGRNSGVIHAGLYYAPGSLKARLCVEGGRRLMAYCDEHGIERTQTGKLVVATDDSQLDALGELQRRAEANGVSAERIGPSEITDHEPHAQGVAALWVSFTGAVDFGQVARSLGSDLEASGGLVVTGFAVDGAETGADGIRLRSGPASVTAGRVVNCAGLHVDRVARLLGTEPGLQILPFRGEYFGLATEGAAMVRGHIYPVPDPRFPHLGVHFTRSVTGHVEVGPNAVWAWGREAYTRVSGSPRDAMETLRYRGFWNLARRHWKTGVGEQWRSLNKPAFVRNARRLLPDLDRDHLDTWRAGIRAQAVATDGSLVHDFVIERSERVVNVLNAPSPAATSCLTIGEYIADQAMRDR